MKILLLTLSLFLTLVACENQTTKHIVSYEKVNAGGCNLEIPLNRSADLNLSNLEQKDTAYCYFENDTLHFFVGLNYVCCAPFIAQGEVNDNHLTMTITDTCQTAGHCYCKCMCYYTWDFAFAKNGVNELNYSIVLENENDGTQALLEGEFIHEAS